MPKKRARRRLIDHTLQFRSTEDVISGFVLPGYSARPGPLKLTAPQSEILKAYDDPAVTEITIKAANQVGKSLLLCVMLARTIISDPRSVFFMHASAIRRDEFMNQKLREFVLSNNALASRLPAPGAPGWGKDSMLIPGGVIEMRTSGNKANFGGVSASVVILDELDVFDVRSGIRNPVLTLSQRRSAFERDTKLIVASSPSEFSTSLVAAWYDQSSKSEWETPCFDCGHKFVMRWENVNIEKCLVICPANQCEIDDYTRQEMIEAGTFVHRTDIRNHMGYHLSQLHSFRDLEDIIKDYHAAVDEDGEGNMPAFRSVCLGEEVNPDDAVEFTWSESAAEKMYVDKRPFDVETARFMGIDVQKNRFEVCNLDYNGDSGMLHVPLYTVIGYDKGSKVEVPIVRDPEMWDRLWNYVDVIAPELCFVDVGNWTTEIREEIDKRDWENIRSCMGARTYSFDRDIDMGKTKHGDQYVATSSAKQMIVDLAMAGMLSVNARETPPWFMRQIMSERLVLDQKGGTVVKRWDAGRRRNEALDTLVYALSAQIIFMRENPYYRRDDDMYEVLNSLNG